ncbi:MAG: peptidylprolyl isomerase [bacterium]
MGSLFRKILCFCLIAAFPTPLFSQSQAIDGVAAIVNDKVITFSEVKQLVDPTEAQLRTAYSGLELVDKVKEARLTALQSLIERELIIQYFNKQSFFIPDNIVEDRIQDIIKTKYEGDRNTLIRTLQANGMSMATFKQEVKNQMIVQAMRAKNVSQVVIISPFQIEKYYQKNIREFIQPKQIHLRLIFLRHGLFKEKHANEKGEQEEMDPQFILIKELKRKIETGEDFGKLARDYSEGTQRDNNGDWGWVSETTLREDLSKVAFSLKPGQISDVVTTEDGYYLLMAEDVQRETVKPLKEVRDEIEKKLLQDERARLQKEWIDGLRSRAFIKMF